MTTLTASTPEGVLPRRPERAGAYVKAQRHSSIVRVLKVFIPVGALVATTIVVGITYFNPFGRMGLSLGPISVSGTKIAMEAPRLTGFKKDARPYEVTADAAYQDIRKPNVVELKDMRAKMAMDESGSIAHLVSNTGIFDTQKEHLDLAGDIRITTTKGEQAQLRSASIDFKTGAVQSHEDVKVTTPTMQVEAASLEMTDNGKAIAFVGRVRVVMQPDAKADGKAEGKSEGAGTPDVQRESSFLSPKLTQADPSTP